MAEVVDPEGPPIGPAQIPPETAFPYPLNAQSKQIPPADGEYHKPLDGPSVESNGQLRAADNIATYDMADESDFDSDSSLTSSSEEQKKSTRRKQESEAHSKQQYSEQKGRKSKKQRKLKNITSSSRFSLGNDYFRTKGGISKRDGRLNIHVNEKANSGYVAKTLGASLKQYLKPHHKDDQAAQSSPTEDHMQEKRLQDILKPHHPHPRLSIVIIVIGSRGDIQPFIKIGKLLQNDYGHRVRLATHPAFKDFVENDSGLEFFSVGGDPSELMAFMVKNPGLIPSLDTVKAGDIGRRRAQMYEMFQGMWRACINTTDNEADKENVKMMGDKHPFLADAIIANPPSFAHIHIAERLGIPLHMMFTFPYTPTTQFPHPLANIKESNVDRAYTNFMSYPLVEMMTWQGLGDLVNKFRVKTLGLDPVSTLWAPGQLSRLQVPYTYLWSPGLVNKPDDWGPEVDIAGYVFLELASSFEPPETLVEFLEAGPPPIYIGFGSIVVDDPDRFTQLIFSAVDQAGVRALVSKGWGGLGGEETPDNIYMLENTPHDWLFPRVSAVVHHGGAGTAAIGLKCGKPTMIVPFFGDQPFWGAMVAKAKAGASKCIPYKKLTAELLAEGIKECTTDEARRNASKIADSIAKEGDGATNAVKSFLTRLPLGGDESMRCSILENKIAVWQLKKSNVKLSAVAAEVLVEKQKLDWTDLRLTRHIEWDDFGGPGGPITGLWSAVYSTISGAAKGVGTVPLGMARTVKTRAHHERKKKQLERRQAKTQMEITTAADGTGIELVSSGGVQPTRRQRSGTQDTQISVLSAEPEENMAQELASEAQHGFHKSAAAVARLPMNMTLGVGLGLHNAPRLYGDHTVRPPPRISGFRSGLRAGRDEFVNGVRDGVTGLVHHPVQGAREDGAMGFLRGVGMGIGGFVIKDMAAVIAPVGFTMNGIHKELQRRKQPTKFLRRARMIEGQNELRKLKLKQDEFEDPEESGPDTKPETREHLEKAVQERWEKLSVSGLQKKPMKRRDRSLFRAKKRKNRVLEDSHQKEGDTVPDTAPEDATNCSEETPSGRETGKQERWSPAKETPNGTAG